MTSMVRRFLLSEHLSSDEVSIEESSGDPLNPWEWFFQEPVTGIEATRENEAPEIRLSGPPQDRLRLAGIFFVSSSEAFGLWFMTVLPCAPRLDLRRRG